LGFTIITMQYLFKVRGSNHTWGAECGCRTRQYDNTWSQATRNGDKILGPDGQWLEVQCPVATFYCKLDEQETPHAGANFHIKRAIDLKDFVFLYAPEEQTVICSDVYENHEFYLLVIPDELQYNFAINNTIQIRVAVGIPDNTVYEKTIPGMPNDLHDDAFRFTPKPGDQYYFYVTVRGDDPNNQPPPSGGEIT
jgi:hypothetical protein